MPNTDEVPVRPAVDARLRRLDATRGYRLVRSHRTVDYVNNCGGYQIVDPDINCAVDGARFDLAPSDVEAWFKDD